MKNLRLLSLPGFAAASTFVAALGLAGCSTTAMVASAPATPPPVPLATPPAIPPATSADVPVVARPNPALIPVPQRTEDGLPQNAVNNFNTRHHRYVARAKEGGIDLLFVGDSITQAWGDRGRPVWEEFYGGMKAAAFGIGYDRTQHLLWRLQNGEGEGFSPKAIVVMIGTNNIGLQSPAEIAAGIGAIVHELRTRFPAAKILLHGIFPRDFKNSRNRLLVAETNRLIAPLHDGRRVHFLDIADKFMDGDGNILPELIQDRVPLHPTAKGYGVWAAAIKEPLAKLLER